MASTNLDAVRGLARAVIEEDVGNHKRWVTAYAGTNHLRDMFTGADGTALTAHAPDENAGNWTNVSSPMELSGNRAIKSTASAGSGAVTHDAGTADGCWSTGVVHSTTPITDGSYELGFRLAAGPANGFSNGWSVFIAKNAIAVGDIRLRLTIGGVVNLNIAAAVLPPNLLDSGGYVQIEVVAIGSHIEVWINGTLTHNITNTTFATQSWVGIENELATGDSRVLFEEVFVTSVPSSGAIGDLGTNNSLSALFPISAVAAGGQLPVKVRWGRIGAPVTQAPNFAQVQLRDDINGLIKSSGDLIGGQTQEGYATVTNLYATSDGNDSAGDTTKHRASTANLLVALGFDDGDGNFVDLNEWHVDSENVFTALVTGVASDNWHGRGYTVPSTTITLVTVPSAAGDPDVSWPELFTLSFTTGARPYRDVVDVTQWSGRTRQGGSNLAFDQNMARSGGDLLTNTTDPFRCDTSYLPSAQLTGTAVDVFFFATNLSSAFNSDPSVVISSAPAGYVVADIVGNLRGTFDRFDGSAKFTANPAVFIDTEPAESGASLLYNRGESYPNAGTTSIRVENAKGDIFSPATAHRIRVWDETDGAVETVHTVVHETTGDSSQIDLTSVTFSATSSLTAGNRATESLQRNPVDTGAQKRLRYDDTAAGAPVVNTGVMARLSQSYELRRHLQVNANSSIQTAETEVRFSRLSSDLGFFCFQVRNRRAQGVSGVAFTTGVISLQDDGSLVPAVTNSGTKTTQTNGYLLPADLISWDSQLPGGPWDLWLTTTVTHNGNKSVAPRQGVGVADFTLLAANPALGVAAAGGPASSLRAKHFTGTGTFQTFAGVIDSAEGIRMLSTTTSPVVSLMQVTLFRVTAAGQLQYFNTDLVWTTVPALGAAIADALHTMAETVAGSGLWVKAFTADATWSTYDIEVIARAVVGGTPYLSGGGKEPVVGAINEHDKYKFDGAGFVGFPQK